MEWLVGSFCLLYVITLWVAFRKHKKFTKVGVDIGGTYGTILSIAAPAFFGYYSLLIVLLVVPFTMWIASESDRTDTLPYF